MEIKLSLLPERVENCEVISSEPGRIVFRTLTDRAVLTLPELSGTPHSGMILTGRVSFDGDTNQGINVSFCDAEKPCAYYYLALMPTVRADIIFRLKYLDGDLLFPPMESSTLKSSVGGSMRPEEIRRVNLFFIRSGVTYTLEDFRLTDAEPELCADCKVMCDEFGQWNARDWEGKTNSLAELRSALDSEVNAPVADSPHDAYGGDKRFPIAEPSDSFRKVKHNGKWWLATPDGNAFFSMGVFGVYPGEYGWIRGNEKYIGELPKPDGEFAEAWTFAEAEELYRRKFSGLFPADTRLYSFATANLIRAFGGGWRKKWTELTESRLRGWSINTLSMFSDPEFIKESRIPYVIMLHRYPTTAKKLYREFPDVFDPEFERAAVVFAKQLLEIADDKSFIGYFMNNEPTFAWDESTLGIKLLEGGVSHSRQALIEWLKERYGSVGAFTEAWERGITDFSELDKPMQSANLTAKALADLADFSAILMRRYAELPAIECRKAAPKKLNLGMRFARLNKLVLGIVDLFDVYSFNRYGYDPTESLDRIAAVIDLPILIGEFHFGATDAGLPAGGIVNAKTQAGRAEAYKNYMLAAASHPNCVGAHWFAWNDQPLWGRYDCENYGFGMVDICNRPYPTFTKMVSEVNNSIIKKRMED